MMEQVSDREVRRDVAVFYLNRAVKLDIIARSRMTAPPALASRPVRLRADLHVHSWHSGFTRSMRVFRSRDCYSAPDEIYRAAKARGMDVVTITDHDSLDGCLEFLARHPDVARLPHRRGNRVPPARVRRPPPPGRVRPHRADARRRAVAARRRTRGGGVPPRRRRRGRAAPSVSLLPRRNLGAPLPGRRPAAGGRRRGAQRHDAACAQRGGRLGRGVVAQPPGRPPAGRDRRQRRARARPRRRRLDVGRRRGAVRCAARLRAAEGRVPRGARPTVDRRRPASRAPPGGSPSRSTASCSTTGAV